MTRTASGWTAGRAGASATPGHDWCVVRLGVPGLVAGFEIDTRHFTGNYPPGAEIEVCRSDEAVPDDEAGWTKVTERLALKGDDRVYVPIEHDEPVTHVRLQHLSRRRRRPAARLGPGRQGLVERSMRTRASTCWRWRMAAAASSPMTSIMARIENLTAPGRGVNMGDGWETRRRREPGPRLGGAGAGRAGADRGSRRRHRPFQRQLSGPLLPPGGGATRPARPRRSRRSRRAGRCCCPR